MSLMKRKPGDIPANGYKLVVTGFITMLILCLSQTVYAGNAKQEQGAVPASKQAPAKVKSNYPEVIIYGYVSGMEQATRDADGAVVVPGRLSGRGRVEAEHVIIEGKLSPGDSPGCIDFGGNLTFASTATLLIEISGADPCTGYDRISVNNTLTINGASLELVLINSFVPNFRQRFDVLDWGLLSGSFASIDTSAAVLPYPLQWDLSQLYITGEVVVSVPNIADGDLAPIDDPDGFINAADELIALQITLDQRIAGPLQYAHGDMNGDDVIDIVDLLLIQQLVLQN